MDISIIQTPEGIREAAALSFNARIAATAGNAALPARAIQDYEARIGWMAREGTLFAATEAGSMRAFAGFFPLEDYRNAGPALFTPDWSMALASGVDAPSAIRPLIRAMLADADSRGYSLHGCGVLANRDDIRREFELSGYGRIMMDAARPTDALLAALSPCPCAGITVRRAGLSDAEALAALDAELAAHIGAPPVLMPSPHGRDAAGWREWLALDKSRAFVADGAGHIDGLAAPERPIAGFIKAEEPQFDVTWTVHSPTTLAIDGMFVSPSLRGRGIGALLLSAIAREAASRAMPLVSVDCETLNPEAFAFWSRYFTPLTWGMERRW